MIKFEIGDERKAILAAWEKEQNAITIGDVLIVRHNFTGDELDLTLIGNEEW